MKIQRLKKYFLFVIVDLLFIIFFSGCFGCDEKTSNPVIFPVGGNGNSDVVYWAETTDGGLSWDPLDSNHNSDVKYIYAGTKISAIPGHFLMCGKDTANRPAIWKSTDYGDTWSMIYHSSVNTHFMKMNYNSVSQSILAIMNNGNVVRSSDNGNTWNNVSFPYFVSAIDFDDPTGRWVAVGHAGLAMYSDDGGVSWTQGTGTGSAAFGDVCFVQNAFTIVVISPITSFRSTDGGVSYVEIDTTFNAQVVSIDRDGKGIILTNSTNPPYYTTTNAGLNWLSGPVSSSATAYNDVVVFDSSLVLATQIDRIIYSTNMGQSWNTTGIYKKMYEINRTDHSSRYVFVLGK